MAHYGHLARPPTHSFGKPAVSRRREMVGRKGISVRKVVAVAAPTTFAAGCAANPRARRRLVGILELHELVMRACGYKLRLGDTQTMFELIN